MPEWSRREALGAVTLLAFANVPTAARATTLLALNRLLIVLADSSRAVRFLNSGLSGLIKSGGAGFPAGQAQRLRAQVRQLSGQVNEVFQSQRVMIRTLDNYYATWPPNDPEGSGRHPDRPRHVRLRYRESDWREVVVETSRLLSNVQGILRFLRNERSDFVSSDAYRRLSRTLQGRESILRVLSSADQPTSVEEYSALRRATEAYRQLHEDLRQTLNLLDRYIVAVSR